MNGICYPVSNNLTELAARGGYMTAACGNALKTLYQTSTAVSGISSEAYTITFTNNEVNKTQSVTQSGKTPCGQMHLHRQSGTANNGPPVDYVNGNTVRIVRYHESGSGNTTGAIAYREMYY